MYDGLRKEGGIGCLSGSLAAPPHADVGLARQHLLGETRLCKFYLLATACVPLHMGRPGRARADGPIFASGLPQTQA